MTKVNKENDNDTILLEEKKTELKKPDMYKVIFHNDDYTTMEFVIFVLQAVFQKSEYESIDIMLEVHHNKLSVVGIYTKDVANTKISETMKLAEEFEYPLLVTMEKN
ncbi:MAG: ATP-dependent Clp protease adaptor ClpS [Candidatus Sericytochromatia bacterium]